MSSAVFGLIRDAYKITDCLFRCVTPIYIRIQTGLVFASCTCWLACYIPAYCCRLFTASCTCSLACYIPGYCCRLFISEKSSYLQIFDLFISKHLGDLKKVEKWIMS